MNKRDPIFWSAAAIFCSGLIITGLTGNQLWLFAFIAAAYLLRPTLASAGLAKSFVDERQLSIQYRSSNLAFFIMIMASMIMAFVQYSKNDHSWEFFNTLVIIGLAAKALFHLLLLNSLRESASKIIITVGALLLLFVTFENGFSTGLLIEGLPFLLIIIAGLVSRRFPKPVGVLVAIAAIVLCYFILHKGFVIGQIIAALLIGLPLLLSGIALLFGTVPREEE